MLCQWRQPLLLYSQRQWHHQRQRQQQQWPPYKTTTAFRLQVQCKCSAREVNTTHTVRQTDPGCSSTSSGRRLLCATNVSVSVMLSFHLLSLLSTALSSGRQLSLSLWLGQFGLCVNLYKNLPATATTTSSVIIVVNSFAALCTIKCIMCSAVWPFQLVLGLSPTLGFKQKTVQLFLTKMVLPSNLLPSLCFLFFLKFTSFGSSALASATDAHILCHLLSFQHSSMRQMFLTCWPHQIYFW